MKTAIVVLTCGWALSVIGQTTNCVAPPEGLVSWWRGEDDTIDSWDSNDAKPSVYRVGYASGLVGRAFGLDAFNIAYVPDSASLRMTNVLTIEVWINPTPQVLTGSVPRTVVSKFGNPYNLTALLSSYYLGLHTNRQVLFMISPNGSAQDVAALTSASALPAGQWSHLAAVYDGAEMQVFINGSLDAKTNHDGGIFAGSADMGIGTIGSGPRATWSIRCLLDELSIYNRALAESEIRSIYEAGSAGKCPASPVIMFPSASLAVPRGEDARFAPIVSGSRPLSYQWYRNGNAVPGATNGVLVIEKVSDSHAGLYHLAATNSAGFAISASVTLSVLPAPTCAMTPAGLISWWPGEGNGEDIVGSSSFTQFYRTNYTGGKVGQAFHFDGRGSMLAINTAQGSEPLAFGTNADFSIEMWIKTETNAPNAILFERVSASDEGYSLYLARGQLGFAIGKFAGSLIPTKDLISVSFGPDLRDGHYHHLAVCVKRTDTSGGRLFVDGQLVGTFDPTSQNRSFPDWPVFIGASLHSNGAFFNGDMDELSVYRRALTEGQVRSIYAAGAAGKCQAGALACTPLPQGAVAWWPGESNTLDVIGGFDGIYWRPQSGNPLLYSTGIVGSAFRFVQVWYVTLPASPALDLAARSGFTFESWINPIRVERQSQAVFGWGGIGPQSTGPLGVRLLVSGAGALEADLVKTDGQMVVLETAPLSVRAGLWQHVALTYDRTNGNAAIYLNGVTMAQTNLGAVTLRTDGILNLGGPTSQLFGSFQGLFDEPALYGHSLSVAEIQSIYAAGSAGKCPPPPCIPAPEGLVAWWPGESNTLDLVSGLDAVVYPPALPVAYIYANGFIGSAFTFPYSPVWYATVPAALELNLGVGDGFTFEAWLRRDSSTSFGGICGWGGQVPNQPSAPIGVRFLVQPNGSLVAYLTRTNNQTPMLQTQPGVIGTNIWQHVALTCNVTNGSKTIYVNGVPVAEASNRGLPDPLLTIGGFGVGHAAGQRLNQASLDEPALYSHALTAAEIQAIHLAGRAGKCRTPLPSPNCMIAPSDIAGWWRGESNTWDSAGINHGALQSILPANFSYASGKKGAAFDLRFNSFVTITNPPNLDVGAGPGLTVEAWINPLASSIPIVEWNSGLPPRTQGVYIAYSATRGPAYLEANLMDDGGQSHVMLSPFMQPVYGQWRHLAVTYDRASGDAVMVVDGFLVTQTNLGSFRPRTTGDLYLGYRPQGNYPGSGTRFYGMIDEVTVYRRALSLSELRCVRRGPEGKYPAAAACVAPADGIVAWWRSESNLVDSVSDNHGAPRGTIAYTNGAVGLGLVTGKAGYVLGGLPRDVNIAADRGLTVEGWINPRLLSPGAVFSSSIAGKISLDYGVGGIGALRASLIDSNGFYRLIAAPGGRTQTGVWQHVALTYDNSSGWGTVFLNGAPVGAGNLGRIVPHAIGPLSLGFGPVGDFEGALDEFAIYNRALTPFEIHAIYTAETGRCTEPPVIVQHPQSLRVNPGSNVTFQVVATGNPLLRYQWGLGQYSPDRIIPIFGATNITFTPASTTSSQTFWVRVTNAFGTALSTNIQLMVNVRPVAQSQQVTLNEDTPTPIALRASDFDGDILTVSIVSNPAHGTLSGTGTNLIYTPHLDYFGSDNFMFTVNDGLADSVTATVFITILPVNDPPVAQPQTVTLDEDTTAEITLMATDAETDRITYTVGKPAHGTLSMTTRSVVYRPATNYFGPDSFSFVASDGQTSSAPAVVSIEVRPVNDAPEARFSISPLAVLPGVTNLLVISPDNRAARIVLDASAATDVENDRLDYVWMEGTNLLATGVMTTNSFRIGSHLITLLVSDGQATDEVGQTIEVVALAESVYLLSGYVQEAQLGKGSENALLASLNAAAAAMERGDFKASLNQLSAFQNKVRAQLASADPEFAAELILGSEVIRDVLSAGQEP